MPIALPEGTSDSQNSGSLRSILWWQDALGAVGELELVILYQKIPHSDCTVCSQPSLSWLRLPPVCSAVGPLCTEQDGRSLLELKAVFQPGLGSRLKPAVRAELWQAGDEHVSSGPPLSATDECFTGRREYRLVPVSDVGHPNPTACVPRDTCTCTQANNYPAHVCCGGVCIQQGRADLLGPSALISSGFNI